MKKTFLLLAAILLSLAPVKAEYQLLDKTKVASKYGTVVNENNCEWTYITNAEEFMKFVSECQDPNVGEKHIRLACDIEYPGVLYQNYSDYYIKYFKGVFDGMGCKIKFKLTIGYSQTVDAAFIQNLIGSNSEVRNIHFEEPHVTSRTAASNLALVVNKVTEGANIHDIYVKGGLLDCLTTEEGSPMISVIACLISSNTHIYNCAIVGTDVRTQKGTIRLFCGDKNGDANLDLCSIHDCYLSGFSNINVDYSCLTNYYGFNPDKLAQYKAKNHSCYYNSENCNINTSSDFQYLETVTSSLLRNLNAAHGWVSQENSMPLPAGLYYWNPNNSRELTIGTYGSSQTLTGQVKPIDYGRFIDVTPLKLTGINYNNKTSYIINDYIANEIGVKNPITAIGENVFPNKEMTTLQLPAGVTTVEGTTFPHSVTQAFISHGNWHFSGNLLYLKTSDISRLMTVVGNNTELSIDCRYCNSILDEALKGQSRLKNLYVNTWFPVDATEYKPVELLGNNVFSGCPNDLNVYIKDGTCINDFGTSGDDDEGNLVQEIIGRDIDHGYKYHENMWSRRFYSESADDDNHLFQYYPVTRNPARLSTIVLGFATSLPSDCRAWVATGVDTEKGELVLKRVQGNILPARLPVLLSYEQTSGIIHLRPYEGTDAPPATMYERSIFRGSIIPKGQKMDASEMQTNFYTLSRLKGSTDWNTVAFRPFHPADGILPSYTAWIPKSLIPDNIAYSADAKFALVFDGDYDLSDTNGITDVADKADAPSAPAYNLSGQRVGSNYRGMIIKNGRKYIAK